MKTKNTNQKRNQNKGTFVMIAILMLVSAGAAAQPQDSTQTLFKSSVKISELWTPEVKINSIQGDIGTLVGFYGGALLNRAGSAWYLRWSKPRTPQSKLRIFWRYYTIYLQARKDVTSQRSDAHCLRNNKRL